VNQVPKSVADLPEWNFDGSSTGQAPGTDSEVHLQPQVRARGRLFGPRSTGQS
jgi:hypothetical protein